MNSVQSVIKYLLSTCHVPGVTRGPGVITMNGAGKVPSAQSSQPHGGAGAAGHLAEAWEKRGAQRSSQKAGGDDDGGSVST